MLKGAWGLFHMDINKEARKDHEAPNVDVINLFGEKMKLLDFVIDERPLVINFGSST